MVMFDFPSSPVTSVSYFGVIWYVTSVFRTVATGPAFVSCGVGSDLTVTVAWEVCWLPPEVKVATGVMVDPPGVIPRGALKVTTVWNEEPAATVPRL